MIIVEGCDGSGKTTLVSHLSQKFNMEVGERGVADRDFLWKVTRQDTYRALGAAVHGNKPAEIWDRLWISEYIYHDINPQRPCEFSDFDTQWIRGVLNAIGCPVILCMPPLDVVRFNSQKAHQMEGVDKALNMIYDRYRRAPLPWPANTIRYDYTGDRYFADLAEVEEEVEGYLDERKQRQAWAV